jgi:hypothetical protein
LGFAREKAASKMLIKLIAGVNAKLLQAQISKAQKRQSICQSFLRF